MTRFLLIRHATNDMVGKTIAGRMAGVHLNEEGRGQVIALVEGLKDVTIDAIYSSPLERCIETAAPVAKEHHLELNIVEETIEVNYGEWTSCSIEELRKDQQFQLYNSFRSLTRIPGGEMMIEVQTRMVAALQKLCRQHNNQTVAVVGHADPIKTAIAYYLGMPIDLMQRIEISAASVSIVEVYEETAVITLLNGQKKF